MSSEDAGSYTCEVETALDAEKATATITVVGENDVTKTKQTKIINELFWLPVNLTAPLFPQTNPLHQLI